MKKIGLTVMSSEKMEKNSHGKQHHEKYTYGWIHGDSICSLYDGSYILRRHIVWIKDKTYVNCKVED
jgi:hypothetical protein